MVIKSQIQRNERLEHWRGSYAETAAAGCWLAAHQWTYGVDVAMETARDVRQKLRLSPDDRLLEIGAGSGGFLEAVLHPGQSGIGFDLCADQVRSADKFGVDQRRIKVGVAEACRIPVAAGSFDKVLCYSVVHYFPDDAYLRATIAEMLRVIRPGGIALLGDVGGVMERTRKSLLRLGPPAAVDGLLWLVLPIRHLYRMLTPRRPREGRFFRRSFLRRLLGEMPCTFEFLDQQLPDRPVSRCRFDIRMVRSS
jgi:SAM-dependent methyltransferase